MKITDRFAEMSVVVGGVLACAVLGAAVPMRNAVTRSVPALRESINRDLLAATEKGDLNAVKDLLAHGADVEAKGYFGRTPLLAAVEKRRVAVAMYLVQQGADPNTKDNQDGHNTAFYQAATDMHSVDLVREMVRRGANVNERDRQFLGDALLTAMVRQNRFQMAQVLVEAGADVNARSARSQPGRTALVYAVGNQSPRMVELLLKHGANPNLFPAERNSDQDAPPLVEAIALKVSEPRRLSKNQQQIIAMLLAHKADVNINDGWLSPLLCAASRHDPALVKVLIDRGAHVNKSFEGGDTPLIGAAASGDAETVRLLLARGADARHRDSDGHDALFYARREKHAFMTKMLQDARTRI